MLSLGWSVYPFSTLLMHSKLICNLNKWNFLRPTEKWRNSKAGGLFIMGSPWIVSEFWSNRDLDGHCGSHGQDYSLNISPTIMFYLNRVWLVLQYPLLNSFYSALSRDSKFGWWPQKLRSRHPSKTIFVYTPLWHNYMLDSLLCCYVRGYLGPVFCQPPPISKKSGEE